MTAPYDPSRWLYRQVSQPAAGAGFSIRPDTRGAWVFHNLAFRFVTSAVAGNRSVLLSVGDINSTWWRGGAPAVVAANSDTTFMAFDGSTEDISALGVTYIVWPSSGLFVPQGGVLTASVTGIDVGDQFSAIVFTAQEVAPVEPEWVEQQVTRSPNAGLFD